MPAPYIISPTLRTKFMYIPPGMCFVGEIDLALREGEVRSMVAITKGFYMQQTPLTCAEYARIYTQERGEWINSPMNNITYDECEEMATLLSKKDGLSYRIPTELEWEYAARGGDGDRFDWAGSNNPDEVAWTEENLNRQQKPLLVGRLKPNGYGLYDMSGLIQEWCAPPETSPIAIGETPKPPWIAPANRDEGEEDEEDVDWGDQHPVRGGAQHMCARQARIGRLIWRSNDQYSWVGARFLIDVP